MEWWLLKRRLRFRLDRQQKRALDGKIPMTKELFWGCLDVFFERYDMERFWEVWHKYPEYIRQWNADFDRDMEDPNSARRKAHDKRWADLQPKLINAFGEDWVKGHCRD